MADKVKVLILASNPGEHARLALDEESRLIEARLRSAEHRDALELIPAWAVRADDLQPLLMRHRPQVVQFSGHGTFEERGGEAANRDMVVKDRSRGQCMALAGEGGEAHLIDAEILVDLFRVLGATVRLVIFNACHSDRTARAVAEVVPCAIGMDGPISDAAAIAFAAAFYQALGFGCDIGQAFDLGRNALMYLKTREDHVPRLHRRGGAPDPAAVVLAGARPASRPEAMGDAVGNLLHAMWDCLDENLQDAFSLAYNKKRRQGGDRISTKDFFQAIVRLDDDAVKRLVASLPPEALPEPIDSMVGRENRLVLEENPLLSDCVADSLEHFQKLSVSPRKLSPTDLFVDIAKHGHGPSVSRLREHGIGEYEIEERVHSLGLPVLRRAAR